MKNKKLGYSLILLSFLFLWIPTLITPIFAESLTEKHLSHISPAYGYENVPITIVIYSDFMDIFTKKQNDETRPELEIFVKNDLVDRLGGNKITFLDCLLNDELLKTNYFDFNSSPTFVIINTDDRNIMIKGAPPSHHFTNIIKLMLGVFDSEKEYWINHRGELVLVSPLTTEKLIERGYLTTKIS